MNIPAEFDEIRPYAPEELPQVFEELIADPMFQAVVGQVMPGIPFDMLAAQMRQCKTNLDFQKAFFYKLLKELVQKCAKGLEFDSVIINDVSSEIYDSKKIISSIKERQHNIENGIVVDNSIKWLEYYYNKVSNKYKYSLFILNITQEDFEKNNFSINHYCNIISSMYDELENYRHLFIITNGIIRDKNGIDQTWNILYKLGIYCENFVRYDKKFLPFKQEKSKEKLISFLNERFPDNNNNEIVDNFYSSISTGFKYEDCLISDNYSTIILSYKKIELDNTPVPCPSCMTTIQQGNSFPEMFLRSYECKNPNCPDRSKSGRGKRFDEFGIYRYCKLIEDEECNQISYELYEKWRRDIFDCNNDIYEMLIKYYSWGGEKISIYPNYNKEYSFDREIILWKYNNKSGKNHYANYETLPIVDFFNSIKKLLVRDTGNKILTDSISIFNEDSAKGIRSLLTGQIGAAITSPPYYNAREYSQWQTLIMYLIDMMINGAAVYDTLQNNSFYLYNIGDIVNSDNVFVESNMSKRRLPLGFLSCMFFELVGFNLG